MGEVDAAESESVAAVMSDLARSMLVSHTRGPARSRSREEVAARARAFIADRHADPTVTSADVAAAVGVGACSLSTLRRDEGGASTMLRSARLRAARTMLADIASDYLTIGEIALRSGFADQTTSIRAFKRHYGALPSEIRELHADA